MKTTEKKHKNLMKISKHNKITKKIGNKIENK